MAEPKYVIKKDDSESRVVAYQPKAIDLDLQAAAKTYLHYQAERKTDFKLSELIAKQTGVADVESEAYKAKIEHEVLLRLKDLQESAYREAFELGKQEGSNRAFESKKSELETLANEFSACINEIKSLRLEILKSKEAELMEMVFLIGKKIALRELSIDSSIVKELLTKLLEEAESDEEVKVHLSEDDHKFIQDQLQSGALVLRDPNKVKFVAEKSVLNGGCLVETQFGSIDSNVEVRVEQAWQAIASRLPRPEAKS